MAAIVANGPEKGLFHWAGYQGKYIVDIVGTLPVILMELDDGNVIKKMYIYADSQIIAQHTGDHQANRYFYLHDRLGSVRQIIDADGQAVAYYSYEPFGRKLPLQSGENVDNPFLFAGQWFDEEINQYYLRARQYDPFLGRFTSRDPVFGRFKEPLTLHPYLYCLNDPVNETDPTGEFLGLIGGTGIIGRMRLKIGASGLAARLGVDRLVIALNLRSTWMELKMIKADTEFLVAEGMARVSQLYANVAWHGNKALIVLSQYVAERSNLKTLEEQRSFISGLMGSDPALPSDWAGGAGASIRAAGEELYEELEDLPD